MQLQMVRAVAKSFRANEFSQLICGKCSTDLLISRPVPDTTVTAINGTSEAKQHLPVVAIRQAKEAPPAASGMGASLVAVASPTKGMPANMVPVSDLPTLVRQSDLFLQQSSPKQRFFCLQPWDQKWCWRMQKGPWGAHLLMLLSLLNPLMMHPVHL